MKTEMIFAGIMIFVILAVTGQAAVEICDGLDNDGNDIVDDGLSFTFGTEIGECNLGVTDCVDGSFINITNSTGPANELCDGLDNDCDGVIDNGFNAGESCISQANSCGDTTSGSYICSIDGLSTVCSAARPAERDEWNQICKSRKNWCGDYNFGRTDCNGVCLAVTPAERSYWLQPCWVINECGQSVQGITDCNGDCPVAAIIAADLDKDGIVDCKDNCKSLYNPSQEDYDRDGIGDICDPVDDSGPNNGNTGGDTGGGTTTPTDNSTNDNGNNGGSGGNTNNGGSSSGSGGGSGGGNSGGSTYGGYKLLNPTDWEGDCFWNCSDWSACTQGNQTRYCTYYHCNENISVPTNRSCQVIIEPEAEFICDPMWDCTEWSTCHNGKQNRDCAATNNCTYPGEPNLTRDCAEEVDAMEEYHFPWWPLLIPLALLALWLIFGKKKDKKGKKARKK